MEFTKMHGLGNDFVILDDRKGRLKNIQKLAVRLCDRRHGVGADQLLILKTSQKADFKMLIFNSDGSEVEMCGNGVRCVAKYIWDKNIKKQRLAIETLAGIIYPEKCGFGIKVDMGKPELSPKMIPLKFSGIKSRVSPLVNYPLKINNRNYRITCVSMGNPHAVIVVNNLDNAPVEAVGSVIERHRLFPNRTNVEFIQILNNKNIRMRVWERGAGETTACGTGASAAVVASSLLGLTERRVSVHLKYGKLLIYWPEKENHVYMTGPAAKVFEGTIEI
ncbi:MAG: diaminopimelate epimerase [Nitrospirae bacterium]|nr:diaminopimelate epimerase [Nitrospirota bacterium]